MALLIAPEDLMFHPLFKLRLAPCITRGLKATGYRVISFCSINSQGCQAPPEMSRLGYINCPDHVSEQMNSVRTRSCTSYMNKLSILSLKMSVTDAQVSTWEHK